MKNAAKHVIGQNIQPDGQEYDPGVDIHESAARTNCDPRSRNANEISFPRTPSPGSDGRSKLWWPIGAAIRPLHQQPPAGAKMSADDDAGLNEADEARPDRYRASATSPLNTNGKRSAPDPRHAAMIFRPSLPELRSANKQSVADEAELSSRTFPARNASAHRQISLPWCFAAT